MKKMLVIMNHELTEDQLKNLKMLEIEPVYMTEFDKGFWANMIPERIEEFMDRVRNNYGPMDYYFVQGHMGATYTLVTGLGARRCWYAQTDRISEDIPQPDGTVKKISKFKHKGFYSYL